MLSRQPSRPLSYLRGCPELRGSDVPAVRIQAAHCRRAVIRRSAQRPGCSAAPDSRRQQEHAATRRRTAAPRADAELRGGVRRGRGRVTSASSRRRFAPRLIPALCGGDRRASRNDTRQFASRGAKDQQRSDQEVQRHGGIASLHLGDARLARLEAPGEVSLRETPAPPPFAQACGQSRLEIDIRSLLGAQAQKFLGSPDLPALCLQPPSLVFTHGRTPSVCECTRQ